MRRRGDPWFKFYPQDWLDGTRELSLEQRGAYIDMIAMQMVYEAPIKDDYAWLAHQMHISSRKAKSIVESLIEATKIRRSDDGLSNVRASFEIESRANQRRVNAETAANRERTKLEKSEKYNENSVKPENSCNETGTTRARLDTDTELDIENTPLKPPKGGDAELEKKFEEFWTAFPGSAPPKGRKTDKPKARETFLRIAQNKHRKGLRASADDMIAGAKCYAAANPDPDYIPMPNTWLNGARWLDDYQEPLSGEKLWWQDQKLLAGMTQDRWRKGINEHANGIWPLDKLGPAPGNPKCLVPRELIAELKLDEIYDSRGIRKCK